MKARPYRPEIGRFLTADRFESSAGDFNLQADPLTQSRFAFAGGNPVTNVEWDGHAPASSFTHGCSGSYGRRCQGGRSYGATAWARKVVSWQQPRTSSGYTTAKRSVRKRLEPRRRPVPIPPDAGRGGYAIFYPGETRCPAANVTDDRHCPGHHTAVAARGNPQLAVNVLTWLFPVGKVKGGVAAGKAGIGLRAVCRQARGRGEGGEGGTPWAAQPGSAAR